MYIRGSSVGIQTAAHWNLIGRRVTAVTPVLSPSSILSPPSYCAFIPARKIRPVFQTCPSVRMEQLSSHRTDFHDIWNLSYRRSIEKFRFSFKSDINNGYFRRRRSHVYDNISLNSSLNEKCFRSNRREKNTHFVSNNNEYTHTHTHTHRNM